MIEDALKLSSGGKLTIFTSLEVKQLLNGRGHLWLSDQRILRCQVMLMGNPGLTISPCEVLNPATLLPIPEGSLPFHSCLETLDHWTKPREGLSEDPLTNPEEIWYTDGSSFVLDGKRRAGYAVVSNFETIEAKPLPQQSRYQDMTTGFTTKESSHGRKQKRTLNTPVNPWEISDTYQDYK